MPSRLVSPWLALGLAVPGCGGGAPEGPPGPAPPGMVWVPGGTFRMGSEAAGAFADERPAHDVTVSGFWMDATEVTNAAFARFVEETGHVTTAERPPDPAELARQLPPGTPPPDPALLVPGSLVFVPPGDARDHVSLDDPGLWWRWTPGADWRHPEGPGSSLEGRGDHPVVHVSWEDAAAYARWAGKELPTEARWERAARGGREGAAHPWGDEPIDRGPPKANTWQGRFPLRNELRDGFAGTAPVGSFPANPYGLHDVAGNVWEWCADLYRPDTYARRAAGGPAVDPRGPDTGFDPQEPYAAKRVQRGGSFLCNASYCAGYRASARMKSTPDSSTSHTGFRCVLSSQR